MPTIFFIPSLGFVSNVLGMFVQRWGILRSAIPRGITLRKTTALVTALAKLHNFCLDQADTRILAMTAGDELKLLSREVGSVPLEDAIVMEGVENDSRDEYRVPRQSIGAGDHFEDVPREIREMRRRAYNDVRLPRERLAKDVVRENNYQQPRPRGT